MILLLSFIVLCLSCESGENLFRCFLEEKDFCKMEKYLASGKGTDRDLTSSIDANDVKATRLCLEYLDKPIIERVLSIDEHSIIKSLVLNNRTSIVDTIFTYSTYLLPNVTMDYLLVIALDNEYEDISLILVKTGRYRPAYGGLYAMVKSAQLGYLSVLKEFFYLKEGEQYNQYFPKNDYYFPKNVKPSGNNFLLSNFISSDVKVFISEARTENGTSIHPYTNGNCNCIIPTEITPEQSLMLLWQQIVKAEMYDGKKVLPSI